MHAKDTTLSQPQNGDGAEHSLYPISTTSTRTTTLGQPIFEQRNDLLSQKGYTGWG